jgi:dienelactone hydrolase
MTMARHEFTPTSLSLAAVTALFLCAACLAEGRVPDNTALRTADELWRGYNPRSLPLEPETVREWSTGTTVLRKVYYTSEFDQGHRVRIIAYYGFPKTQRRVPAILHIHGGGQTASKGYVNYWVRRGYAALSINWGGYPLEGNPAEGNTDWGPLYVNAGDGLKPYLTKPSARSNAWYHWAVAARRGLTFLEQQPEVDPSRFGVLGISMGGRLTWLVAGSDARVKAAVSVYGAVAITEPVNGLPGSEQVTLPPEDRQLWRATLDAQAYASKIRRPFFYLSSANDFYGAMDFASRALGMFRHRNRWMSFTPHFNHHIGAEQAAALPMWMDRWLKGGERWPAGPSVRLELGTPDRVPRAVVTPDRADGVSKVSIYYSTESYPQSRFWRSAVSERESGAWAARLPLTVENQSLYAFANVLYDSGLSLSTNVAIATPEALRDAGIQATDPQSLLIEDFQGGSEDWFANMASPDLDTAEKPFFRVVDGQDGRRALQAHERQGAHWKFSTRKIGDPKWKGPAGGALQFLIRAAQPNTILVIATENEGRPPRRARVFLSQLAVRGGDGWQTLKAPLASFHLLDGDETLASWDGVNLLSIQAQYPILPVSGDPAKRRTLGVRWQGPGPAIARMEWILSRDAPGARPGMPACECGKNNLQTVHGPL